MGDKVSGLVNPPFAVHQGEDATVYFRRTNAGTTSPPAPLIHLNDEILFAVQVLYKSGEEEKNTDHSQPHSFVIFKRVKLHHEVISWL